MVIRVGRHTTMSERGECCSGLGDSQRETTVAKQSCTALCEIQFRHGIRTTLSTCIWIFVQIPKREQQLQEEKRIDTRRIVKRVETMQGALEYN